MGMSTEKLPHTGKELNVLKVLGAGRKQKLFIPEL